MKSRNETAIEDRVGSSSQAGPVVPAATGTLTALASHHGDPDNGPPPPADKPVSNEEIVSEPVSLKRKDGDSTSAPETDPSDQPTAHVSTRRNDCDAPPNGVVADQGPHSTAQQDATGPIVDGVDGVTGPSDQPTAHVYTRVNDSDDASNGVVADKGPHSTAQQDATGPIVDGVDDVTGPSDQPTAHANTRVNYCDDASDGVVADKGPHSTAQQDATGPIVDGVDDVTGPSDQPTAHANTRVNYCDDASDGVVADKGPQSTAQQDATGPIVDDVDGDGDAVMSDNSSLNSTGSRAAFDPARDSKNCNSCPLSASIGQGSTSTRADAAVKGPQQPTPVGVTVEDVDMGSEAQGGEAVEAAQGDMASQTSKAEEKQAQRLCDEACRRLLDAPDFMAPKTSGWSVEQLVALRGGVLELGAALCGRGRPRVRASSVNEAVDVITRYVQRRLS